MTNRYAIWVTPFNSEFFSGTCPDFFFDYGKSLRDLCGIMGSKHNNIIMENNVMQQNTKSATTAGLLGIFLGTVGAHNWYLGEKTKGIIHVCITGGGFLLMIISGALLSNVLSFVVWLRLAPILNGIAWLAIEIGRHTSELQSHA